MNPREIVYDASHERGTLDAWSLPSDDGGPLLVWLHGGGLQQGGKRTDEPYSMMHRLVEEGVAVVSANYRLYPSARYPQFIEDAAAATAWALGHARELGADPARVVLSGHSAGAYLAAMVALDEAYLAAAGCSANLLAGCMPVSGTMFCHFEVQGRGEAPAGDAQLNRGAPLVHARADAPAWLAFAAQHDLPGRVDENRRLVEDLNRLAPGRARFVEVPACDHGSIVSNPTARDDPFLCEALAWLHAR